MHVHIRIKIKRLCCDVYGNYKNKETVAVICDVVGRIRMRNRVMGWGRKERVNNVILVQVFHSFYLYLLVEHEWRMMMVVAVLV